VQIRTLFLLSASPQLRGAGSKSANERLQAEYDLLLDQARELEALRLRLRRTNRERVNNLFLRLGIDNKNGGRASGDKIPDELVDVVEPIGKLNMKYLFP